MRTLIPHLRIRRLLPLALLLCALAAATPAAARPLGHNGQIAFGRYDPFFDDTVPYTINPDGTHEQRAIDIPGEFPDWSPDGTLLSSCCSPVGDSHSAATIVNPDDPGGYVALPQPDPANLDLYCGPWSADGARLACEGYGTSDDSRNGIYTIRFSDGGGQARNSATWPAATSTRSTPTAAACSRSPTAAPTSPTSPRTGARTRSRAADRDGGPARGGEALGVFLGAATTLCGCRLGALTRPRRARTRRRSP